ncbi:MAG TPA: Gfo/Idh/MocA family oxidoreductase [Vicinamibacterales bacterium]|nr:Gfo/Idh/MocA family oxidoreductase [Vicinamibacterales bacterium]
MRIGILGAGGISDTHVRAAQGIDGVEVVAVHGGNRDKAAALAHRAGAVAYDTLESFLAAPMDAIAIGSPSGLHAEQAIAAIRRGLHVIVEKPLDITPARIDALIAEADRARVKVGVFFQERLLPELVAIKQKIDSGAIGKPVFIAGRLPWYRPPEYYANSRWRGTRALDGGGALMNQGIHTVDVLLWLFGPVSGVMGRTANRLHQIEVEDTAVAALEFENGAFGTIEATTAAAPGFPRRLEINGTEATIVHEEPARAAVVGDAAPHRRVLEDFIRAVRAGAAPACDAREGRRSVAVIDAIYRSARSGRMEKP